MNKERFINILRDNEKLKLEIDEKVEKFYDKYDLKPYDDALKSLQAFGDSINVKYFQIPLADNDIRAFLMEGFKWDYMILNSSIPRNLVKFSFYHDLYHSLHETSNGIKHTDGEVIIPDTYYNDYIERKASLFAANIIMPELHFKHHYRKAEKWYDNLEDRIFYLMYTFEATLTSVVLRILELNILDSIDDAYNILSNSEEQIKEKFEELLLDKDSLLPSKKDQSIILIEDVKNTGEKLIELDLFTRNKLDRVINKLEKLLTKIKGEKSYD